MKRRLRLFLMLLLLLALSACGDEVRPPEADSPPPAEEGQEESQEETSKMILVGVLVDGERINIRSGPSTDSEILGVAHQGQMFQVLAQNVAPGWHQLAYGDGVAYISADYLYLSEWEQEAQFLLGIVVDVQGYVNVRNQPSDQGEIVGTGILGATFVVRKENYQPGWHQVDWRGSAAYINARYLQVEQTSIAEVLHLNEAASEPLEP